MIHNCYPLQLKTVPRRTRLLTCVALLGVLGVVFALHLVCSQTTKLAVTRPDISLTTFGTPVSTSLPQTVEDYIYDPSVLINSSNWRRWREQYNSINEIFDNRKIDLGTEMLRSLNDPYSLFLGPPEVCRENERYSGNSFHAGFTIEMHRVAGYSHDVMVVTEVSEGLPASAAGLCVGDVLIEVDGNNMKNCREPGEWDKVFRRCANTAALHLTVERGHSCIKLNIIREFVTENQVTWKWMPGNIGYLRLRSFSQADTLQQMKAALNRLRFSDSIVFDLRDNPGGLLQNASGVTALFLQQGIMCKVKERVPGHATRPSWTIETSYFRNDAEYSESKVVGKYNSSLHRYHREPYLLRHRPLIVLINGNSASASELVAGALKDNHVGLLVGEKTFGKGVGQRILQMPDGTRLHVTCFRYITPLGFWPGDGASRRNGISPNIEVKQAENIKCGSKDDVQLRAALRLAMLLKK